MKKNKKNMVVIALSGGVDSAAAAILLKQKKFKLQAVYMQNWDIELNEKNAIPSNKEGCSNIKDLEDVKYICEKLEIPLKIYNFVPEYWEKVFQPYLDDLKKNLNSNPDILCNEKIKFGVLLNQIKKDFGKNIKMATGHWAKILKKQDNYYLSCCKNKDKDQTYFLSRLNEKQLQSTIFPLANIENKNEARQLVKKYELSIWDKKESMGICFIGKREYPEFIENFLESKEGNLVDIETQQILGKHKGTHLYVLNQRKGFALKGYKEKYYVCGKDIDKNIVFLCRKSQLPKYLHKKVSCCENTHWINAKPKIEDIVYIKTRHNKSFLRSQIIKIKKDFCQIKHRKKFITTPGQYIVFYGKNKKICLGSGIYKEW